MKDIINTDRLETLNIVRPVRPMTRFIIRQFPEFFTLLEKYLIQARMSLHIETYISLTLISMSLVLTGGVPLFTFLFLWYYDPLYLAVGKAFILTLILTLSIMALFYLYPRSCVISRKRSIDANLPFVITHLESIVSAGISPSRMFDLVADQGYGELSTELIQLQRLVRTAGYDMTAAIKQIVLTTPSPAFKEFLSGIVTTTESGGDLPSYLRTQAKASLNEYELNRQRYSESMSLYSEIYTGLMVAGPVILILSLVLVSILGGQIAGLDVNTIITFGTYLVIPLMNILFIIFLQIAQPDTQ